LSYTGQGVVAASDAGDDVSLFQDPDYDIDLMRWQIGDTGISWTGRRRDDAGNVIEGGIYTTPVTFDDHGNIASSGATELLMSLPLVSDSSGTLWPDVSYYDWSPDGAQFVSSSFSRDELRVGSIDTGEFEVLYSDSGRTVSDPQWSPAGDAIMFNHFTGWNEVDSINPDGSGYTKLAGSSPTWSRSVGVWSPTGSHLILKHFDRRLDDSYLLRANSNGGQRKRLTGKDVGDFLGPQVYGWREAPVAASAGFASVPEPSTATIVVIGLSTLLGYSRRRGTSNC
jgi:dipeptidyl aminopeptidase/acylaminoacyl peptidase